MIRRPCTIAIVWIVVLACLEASCGKAPPPPPAAPQAPVTIAAPPDAPKATPASMTLAAAADVNPNASGRPSPVVVRIYQLRADSAFAAADFLALFDQEAQTLGPELITRDEYVLAPSEQRTLDISVAPDTRFIGALAAFRDFRSAQWRALVPARRGSLSVRVEGTRIVLSTGN